MTQTNREPKQENWFKRHWNAKSFADELTLKRNVQDVVSKAFMLTLIVGMCFAILYPIIKLFPTVFNDVEDLGNPDVVWIPVNYSTLSFKAAIRCCSGNGNFFWLMFQSLIYAAIIAVIQVFICGMAGYTLGRIKVPFRTLILVLVVFTFVVPPQSLLISQYLRFKHFDIFGLFKLFTGSDVDLVNNPITLYLIALLGFGVKQSLFVFIFRQFFKDLPKELEEAALIDGCGFYKTYFSIALPNARPSILTVGILAFVWNYSDTYYTSYFHPEGPYLAMQISQTLQTSRSNTVVDQIIKWYDKPKTSSLAFDAVRQAAAILYLIPLLIVYFVTQKSLVENFGRSGIVG